MKNGNEPVTLSIAEFTDGNEIDLDNEINRVERMGIATRINRERYEIELEPDFGNDWEDVARSAFRSLQSSGIAATLDKVEDRCELMDSWKECAMDVLGYTRFS